MVPSLVGMVRISPVAIVVLFVFLAIALLGASAFVVFLVRSVVKLVRWAGAPRTDQHVDRLTRQDSPRDYQRAASGKESQP